MSVKYPVGQQSFSVLREDGCLYVDKTRYIEKILNKGDKYFFLSRPRRFGKSLFLSTLKFFFLGRRDLFSGLYADTSMEWNWEPYPVLYIDLNTGQYRDEKGLQNLIHVQLSEWEGIYGKNEGENDNTTRFRGIIERAHRQTGRKVVILVDEYDKPLINTLDNKDLFERNRSALYSLYSNFKSSADHLELVFLTGVGRFGKLSVFSGLNNINDISFSREFADVCGITDIELKENFKEGISDLAKEQEMGYEETLAELKKYYDGYHFHPKGSDVYNPYSLLKVMGNREFYNYWIESGTPTLLAEQVRRFDCNLQKFLNIHCKQSELTGLDLDSPLPIALFYQTGYLTIKGYDRISKMYKLGVPNEEVREGFFEFLLPCYVNLKDTTAFVIYEFVQDCINGRPESFMTRLQRLLSSITYQLHIDYENNLQNVLYILMILVGLRVDAEFETSDGQIDLLVTTDRYRYVIELKIDSTAEEALRQIDDKHYVQPFVMEGRKIFKIGTSFSTITRTLSKWVIETV